MRYNPDIHHRRSIRLKGYDYSQDGVYFVTICTHNRECLFGKIVDGKMCINEWGKIAERCWLETPQHYPNVSMDEFVIMPNHIHRIIILNENISIIGANVVGAKDFSPLHNNRLCGTSRTIGFIVRGFKIVYTKLFHKLQHTLGIRWRKCPETSQEKGLQDRHTPHRYRNAVDRRNLTRRGDIQTEQSGQGHIHKWVHKELCYPREEVRAKLDLSTEAIPSRCIQED